MHARISSRPQRLGMALKVTVSKRHSFETSQLPNVIVSKRHRVETLIPLRVVSLSSKAGEGNRTLVFSLEGYGSTIELHPQ